MNTITACSWRVHAWAKTTCYVQELTRGKDGTLTLLYEARKSFRGVAVEDKDADGDGNWQGLGVDEEGELINREDVYNEYIWQEEDLKPRPMSPTFYTGCARYFDVLSHLHQSMGQAHSTLKTLQLVLVSSHFTRSGNQRQTCPLELNTARYHRLVVDLNKFNECLQIATTSSCTHLADMLDSIEPAIISTQRCF